METEELIEVGKEAHGPGQRLIGVTMAIAAAFLAMVTLMGHRLHTEDVVMQTKAADGWAYFQAKNNRSHMYATDAKLAELTGAAAAPPLVEEWTKKAKEEREQADDIRKETERLDHETEGTAHRATLFDLSEIGLEVGIVLCSVALLTGSSAFWGVSFVPMAIGLLVAAYGLTR